MEASKTIKRFKDTLLFVFGRTTHLTILNGRKNNIMDFFLSWF